MNLKRLSILVVLPVLLVGLVASARISTGLASTGPANRSVSRQIAETPCFVVADNEDTGNLDTLTAIEFSTGNATLIGSTGTRNIEAIAFQPSTRTLFAADGGRVGTLNQSTGVFSALPSNVGTVRGPNGSTEAITDLDGLTFDPATGILYGSERIHITGSEDDILVQINHVTGLAIQNAFGPGLDFVPLNPSQDPILSNGFHDVDDIAIDPSNGQMYAILNDGGVGDRLVRVNKQTGLLSNVAVLGVDDMEGLSFDPTGQLLGTTGKAGGQWSNRLFHINKDTGMTITATSKLIETGTDFEASDCLTAPPVPTATPTPTDVPTATFTPTPTATLTPTPTSTEGTAITVLSFNVQRVDGRQVTLAWTTAAEINNAGFQIYRAAVNNLGAAQKVQFIASTGQGRGTKSYTYSDTAPAAGTWYYWLAAVDRSGVETVMNATSVIVSGGKSHILHLPLLTRQNQ